MRTILCLACVLACCSVEAQETRLDAPESDAPTSAARRDPTAPSAEILERLNLATPMVDAFAGEPAAPAPADEVAQVAPAFPEIILKGLVLSDSDHGTALLEAAGRRVTVRLSREPADAAVLPAANASRLSGFSIQGIEFYVLDFSDRSLLLQAADRTILVQ